MLTSVAIPLLNQMITTSITLPLEMLEAATTYRQLDGEPSTPPVVRFYGDGLTAVTTSGQLQLTPNFDFVDATLAAELVLIPALWRNPMQALRKNPKLIPWLQQQYQQGATFAVAGTGVVFLAAAGLLDHQPATTHWFYLDTLQKQFPAVCFKPDHLITQSDRIYCAGSVNSIADLMVHLISLCSNDSVAQRVEQQFSHEIRKSFQKYHYAEDHISSHDDEQVALLQSLLIAQYSQPWTINQLCQQSGLSVRTLNRRFQQAIGVAPLAYLKKIRLEQASDLLKDTNLSVMDIALQVGYTDSDYFARLFKQQFFLSPSAFRKSVRNKLFYLE